ncbi:MAG: hypothetical protein SFT90_04240 [Rickettsiales bacterium]|nr:hypothetical protein [Rickettsiales bacterium]
MKLFSVNILSLFAIFLCSACMQEFVEKDYKSTVAGYDATRGKQTDDGNVFAVTDNSVKSRLNNNVPVIISDPLAVSNGTPTPQRVSYSPNVFQNSPSNPYGSLGYAPTGLFNPNVMMQNTSPVYNQPAIGNNIYAPVRR